MSNPSMILSHVSGPLVTRFAPSPTGYLHMGHVISMLYVFGVAAQVGAKVLLRMEDHDRERCRKEYEIAILEDMEWLGFIPHNWTEFTQKVTTRYRQSDQLEVYGATLDRLQGMCRTYACTCSRRLLGDDNDSAERPYPGICRQKNHPLIADAGCRFVIENETETFYDAIRGHMEQKPAMQCGDFLLKDRRGYYTYNFAVVVDDMDQGVNLVVRGEDILHCTGRQIALARTLGAVTMPLYFHHPLALGPDGKKLSKRTFSEGIIHRRLAGESPEAVIENALSLIGDDAPWLRSFYQQRIQGPRP